MAEKAAMARVLSGCPAYPLPRGGAALPTPIAAAPVPVAPAPTAAPVTGPTTPSSPANPGNTRNCGDFATWAQADAWYQTYVGAYGDVAQLDADHDGIVCESLSGAP